MIASHVVHGCMRRRGQRVWLRQPARWRVTHLSHSPGRHCRSVRALLYDESPMLHLQQVLRKHSVIFGLWRDNGTFYC